MNIIWYALWFIVAVSLLVTVHEFGHFWVARRLGFKVLRFSVGFGRPLLKKVGRGPDHTEYVIAAIPLGGYVKMLDEREGPVPPEDLERSFTRRPPWQRIAVLLAGPMFNIAFAIIVLWGMFWASGVTEVRAVVGAVTPDSVAARAGLHPGDQILTINEQPARSQRDVVFGLLDSMSSDGSASLKVQSREGSPRNATLTVSSSEERRRLTEPSLLFQGLGFQFWHPVVLAQVTADGPAGRAGLKAGDQIVAVGGKLISNVSDVAQLIGEAAGQEIAVRYRRGNSEQSAVVVPVATDVDGKQVGRINVSMGAGGPYPESMLAHTELSPVAAFGHASVEAWDMTVLQARLFWRMITGHVSLKNLSGPLSIAEFAGESADAGVAPFLSFLVLISLSLGFLNLLPIPILDGGQIVFQLAEWLKGSPLSDRAQVFGQQVGIALLILLMSVALFNDIARQFN